MAGAPALCVLIYPLNDNLAIFNIHGCNGQWVTFFLKFDAHSSLASAAWPLTPSQLFQDIVS